MKNVKWLLGDSTITTVIEHILPKLWKKGIKSEISVTNNISDIDTVNKQVYARFVSFCIDNDSINNAAKMKRMQALVKSNEDNKVTADIIRKDLIPDELTFVDNTSKKDCIIVIGICLNKDDDCEILHGSGINPTLSMRLYHNLSEAGYKVFLYSGFMVPEVFLDPWKQKYKQIYGVDNICIITREGRELLYIM